MGRDLYNKVLSVRGAMDRADKALASEGFKVTKACFVGSAEDLNKPSIAAPAQLAIAFGIAEALKAKKVHPQMALGYGWGEAVALACLGVLPFEDALRFLRQRGQILEEAWKAQPFHVMLVTGLSPAALAEKFSALPQKPDLIADDSPDACVLAGPEALLKQLSGLLQAKGVKCSAVAPGISWPHASLAQAGRQVAEEFSKLKWERVGNWNLYSCSRGSRLADFQLLPEIQAELCSGPLRFKEAAAAMRSAGMDTVVEIGPGQALGGFVRKLDSGVRALASEDSKSLSAALKLAV
jgi:[acyl-carrier-protein] S-malonyltransferase